MQQRRECDDIDICARPRRELGEQCVQRRHDEVVRLHGTADRHPDRRQQLFHAVHRHVMQRHGRLHAVGAEHTPEFSPSHAHIGQR